MYENMNYLLWFFCFSVFWGECCCLGTVFCGLWVVVFGPCVVGVERLWTHTGSKGKGIQVVLLEMRSIGKRFKWLLFLSINDRFCVQLCLKLSGMSMNRSKKFLLV